MKNIADKIFFKKIYEIRAHFYVLRNLDFLMLSPIKLSAERTKGSTGQVNQAKHDGNITHNILDHS